MHPAQTCVTPQGTKLSLRGPPGSASSAVRIFHVADIGWPRPCVEDESDWLYVACASMICHARHACHAYLAYYALHSLHAGCVPGEQQAQGACARGDHTAASDSGTFNLVSFLQWPFGRLCCPDMRGLLTPKAPGSAVSVQVQLRLWTQKEQRPVSDLD